jgi:DNA-binding SARP family transcriptional activator
VYAVALNDAGKTTDAIEVLEASINAHPYDRDSLRALATFLEQAGDSARARGYTQRLNELDSGNPDGRLMLKQLSGNRNG